jgi:hypothetical protein
MIPDDPSPHPRALRIRHDTGARELIGVFTLLGACIGSFLAALAIPLLLLALWVKWAFGL